MKKMLIAMLGLALCTGCSKDLSRGKAKDLIIAYRHYDQSIQVAFNTTEDERREILKRGYWEGRNLSPLGQKFFVQGNHCLITVAKVTPAVEITGIRGDNSQATVQYTVQWFTELPREIRDMFKDRAPERHDIVMERYDDGWRATGFFDPPFAGVCPADWGWR